MQDKANLRKSQMNANLYNTTDYENKWQRKVRKNKPNSNPIKPNFRKPKMNASVFATKDYRKKDTFAAQKNKPNSNPISEKTKMNVNLYIIEDYENKTTLRPQKNKPNQSQFQTGHQPPPTSYLPPQSSLKFTLKNAPAPLRSRYVAQEIFEKLLIYTGFYSIIVLFYTLYYIQRGTFISRMNMEKVYNAN